MELALAEQIACDLMREFGLTQNGWSFRWDDAKRRFGSCSNGRRRITLSSDLTRRNDQAQVEDTIRHEIAHALAGAGHWHDDEWKRQCAVTGAKPERCYNSDVEKEEGDWRATCGGCGALHTKLRRPKRNGQTYCALKDCKSKFGRRFHPLTRLVFRHVNEVFDPTTYAKEVLGIAEKKGVVLQGKVMVTAESYRAAMEHMKQQLKKQEEGL